MVIIHDTCSIIMLIRVNPDMFKDPKYECVMMPDSYNEYTSSKKFKEKYEWRNDFKSKLQSLTTSQIKACGAEAALKEINQVVYFCENAKRQACYANLLSYADKRIAAATIGLEGTLCTMDGPLRDFVSNELDCKVVSPLEVLNDWLEKELLKWDDTKMSIVQDWVNKEARQPLTQIERFEKLTGCKYPQ